MSRRRSRQRRAVIDFTAPASLGGARQKAAERGMVHIIGTTGSPTDDETAIRQAARAGARIVKAGNFSLGVNLLLGLVKKAAAELPGFDIEILEMHHNQKVDAPSGTADAGRSGGGRPQHRSSPGFGAGARRAYRPREPGTIGFATLRGGNVIGEHR
jgi:4-hydroxy-tetrahydrodipicolinate reductase